MAPQKNYKRHFNLSLCLVVLFRAFVDLVDFVLSCDRRVPFLVVFFSTKPGFGSEGGEGAIPSFGERKSFVRRVVKRDVQFETIRRHAIVIVSPCFDAASRGAEGR